jgi:aryl-alcohol dehydrogenase-like predicted oxidoreductase
MTFGSDWGWGADQDEARVVFDLYVDRGGNFIDTANQYTNGTSEEFIGIFARQKRDQLVIATKYTLPTKAGDANSGGNHRKSMVRSVEMSLRRLQTNYIDLLYLHAWDFTTPVEEVLRAMDDLVRAGKVLYVGISNSPAWQISRMQAIAQLRGWSPLIALQVQYNLIERGAERDLIPMAEEMGLAVMPWAPLAGGILSGKYSREARRVDESDLQADCARKDLLSEIGALSGRAIEIADVVRKIAAEMNRTPAQVALAWTLHNPAVVCPVLGARTAKQLRDNLGALELTLNQDQLAALAAANTTLRGYPHDYLDWVLGSSFMAPCMKISRRRN